MGKLALAQQHLTEGLDLAREVGDRYTEPLLLAGLADVHKDLARYDKAIELRLAAHEMIMAGMRGHESDSLNGLGELYAEAGLADQARQWFERAIAVTGERGERHQHGRALAGLGRLLGSREHLLAAIDILDAVSPLEAEQVRQALDAL